ncbi:MAG: HEAT repeat domain-containing protein [Chitinispirillaceae bacterium]
MRRRKNCNYRFWILVLFICCASSVSAKTRWSSLQFIPHADLIPSGRFMVDASLFWAMDTFTFSSPVALQSVEFGVSEWLNLDIGYTEGFTMGFKTCFLRETSGYIPSMTLGVQNLFTNKETGYFGRDREYPENEIFLALAKSMEVIKMRVHAGALSAPSSEDNLFNPFFGFEKYFGVGFYMSFEGQMRDRHMFFSLFTSWRTVKDRLEINFGIVDLENAFADSYERSVVKPGLRAGIRVNLGSGLNTMDGLLGLEDRIDRQNDRLSSIDTRVDSLKKEVSWNSKLISQRSGYPEKYLEQRASVLDELKKLANLYEREPFDPKEVQAALDFIVSRREQFAPHLRVIVTDVNVEARIRALTATLIGQIGDRKASGILIAMLDRPGDPSIKIEAIIALGRMKETQAADVLRKLMTDADEAVAFTASEVLRKLLNQTEKVRNQNDAVSGKRVITVPEKRISREEFVTSDSEGDK